MGVLRKSGGTKNIKGESVNTYKILVKGSDPFGFDFLENVVRMANKGATIDREHIVRMEFPHQCVMFIETEERMETDITKGVEVFPCRVFQTQEELENMEWEEMKKVCKKHFGLTGRDRKIMIQQYMGFVEENRVVVE